jgi:ABC-type multidrug transport system ATPase subunit
VPDASDALGDLCAREFVDLVRALKGGAPNEQDAALERALAFPVLAPRPMRELSLGQRKRVCLLAALFGDPQVLVLDEPSNGLDPDGVTWVVHLLHERATRGQITVFSTNDPAFLARIGANVLRLAEGQLHPTRSL